MMRKKILIMIVQVFLFTAMGYAQSAYEQFRKRMTEIEQEEQILRKEIWGDKNIPPERLDSLRKVYEVFAQDKMKFALQAVRENPEDERFLKVLDIYVRNFLTLDEFGKELKGFSRQVRKTETCQRNFEFIRCARKIQLGKRCPEIIIPGHQGEKICLSDLLKQNKVVIVDFWASWCGPCRKTMPALKKLYRKYHDRGVEILSVSLDDDKKAWDKAYQDEELTWKDGSNLQGWKDPLVLQFAIRGIPHKILIGANRKIIGLKEQDFERILDDYLK